METYKFFKSLALKACVVADSNYVKKCSHDVNTIDEWVQKLIDIQKKYNK